ncbi:hypothetical protein VTH06DRAFT_6407 [Thermothelomyces fergusii]
MGLLLTTVLPVIMAAAITMRVLLSGRRPRKLPPGPPTLPVIGNLHQIPKRDVHLQFEKWAREYGQIYSLILGTKPLIVLSSDKAVKDLLDKKSNIYSHRQEMYIGQTLCSGDLRILMMGYDARWRMCRKLVHSLLNIAVAKSYVPYQMLENKQMLYEMVTQPERCMYNIRRYSNSQITTIVFGWRSSAYEDNKMIQLYDGFSEFSKLNQTGLATFIDYFPWTRWLPDFVLSIRTKAKELHRKEKDLYLGHWLEAKEKTKSGTIMRCFSEDLVAAQRAEGFSDDQAAYITGTLLEAGSDTTSNTLYAFVQAMLLYLAAQRKAQEEIDLVVGPDRMPTMNDECDLQYVRAIVKETLRWMPTAILGAVPHAVTQDDWYEGYLIPKNSGIINNVWAINMDPARHPEPRRFNLDRYKEDYQSLADAAVNLDVSKRDQFTFGAGRRICPGIHVAERSLFLGVSRMLWAFDISPATDACTGKPIIPDQAKLTQGFVCQPEEFPVKITPRSEARRVMVVEEWLNAEKEYLDLATKQWKISPLGEGKGKRLLVT